MQYITYQPDAQVCIGCLRFRTFQQAIAVVKRDPNRPSEWSCCDACCALQILAAEVGAADWNSDEEDGFDPYWGVVPETDFTEACVKKNADFLLRQLTPLLGRHAYKCGFLEKLAGITQVPLEGLTQPGGCMHNTGHV